MFYKAYAEELIKVLLRETSLEEEYIAFSTLKEDFGIRAAHQLARFRNPTFEGQQAAAVEETTTPISEVTANKDSHEQLAKRTQKVDE